GIAAPGERLHGGAYPCDIAVMIGAPDIERDIVATLEFVEVIGDVAGKVGARAVPAFKHAVLLVTELACLEPQCALPLVGVAAFGQSLERTLNGAFRDQRGFREPTIELHI